MKRRVAAGTVLALCLCILSGCGFAAPAETDPPTPPPTAAETAAPRVTAAPMPTATSTPVPKATLVPTPTPTATPEAAGPDYLILVDRAHPIDPGFLESIELVEVSGADGGIYELEAETAAAFAALQSALAEQGVVIAVESAYRSVERQTEIMEAFIEYYGEDYARRVAAEPGTSEHHTGLAVDLIPWIDGAWAGADADAAAKAEVYAVIHAALPDFGFILRYPAGKEEITGYDYEPWHIRYVGSADIAREIHEQGLTLEEYLAR